MLERHLLLLPGTGLPARPALHPGAGLPAPPALAFGQQLHSGGAGTSSLTVSVSLTRSCRTELRLCLLLVCWTGVSFYEGRLACPVGVNLFTDAAPSAGFGGFYNGRWFAERWPPELAEGRQVPSLALSEFYPIS